MFKHLSSLIWSRKEILLANKQSSILLLFPLILVAIYSLIFRGKPDANYMIFSIVISMIGGMIGALLPILIGEEVEKNNQRSLLLAGVKYEEYLLSNLVIPFGTVLVYLVALPFLLQISLKNWLSYLVVNIVTVLVIFMINMIVALMSDTQAKASMYSMPVMLSSLMLPMLAMSDGTLGRVVDFTFMGAYSKWNIEGAAYSLTDKTFIVLVGWLLVAFAVAILLVKRSKVKE